MFRQRGKRQPINLYVQTYLPQREFTSYAAYRSSRVNRRSYWKLLVYYYYLVLRKLFRSILKYVILAALLICVFYQVIFVFELRKLIFRLPSAKKMLYDLFWAACQYKQVTAKRRTRSQLIEWPPPVLVCLEYWISDCRWEGSRLLVLRMAILIK